MVLLCEQNELPKTGEKTTATKPSAGGWSKVDTKNNLKRKNNTKDKIFDMWVPKKTSYTTLEVFHETIN